MPEHKPITEEELVKWEAVCKDDREDAEFDPLCANCQHCDTKASDPPCNTCGENNYSWEYWDWRERLIAEVRRLQQYERACTGVDLPADCEGILAEAREALDAFAFKAHELDFNGAPCICTYVSKADIQNAQRVLARLGR